MFNGDSRGNSARYSAPLRRLATYNLPTTFPSQCFRTSVETPGLSRGRTRRTGPAGEGVMATALDDDLIGLVFGFYHSAATDAVLSFATTVIGSNYSHQPCFLLNSVISLAMVSVLGYSFHHIGIRGQQREDGITPHFSQFGGDLNVVIRGKE